MSGDSSSLFKQACSQPQQEYKAHIRHLVAISGINKYLRERQTEGEEREKEGREKMMGEEEAYLTIVYLNLQR